MTASYSPPSTPQGYEPRYEVGDLIRDGRNQTLEIYEIHRAALDDGFSSVDAINSGFTTYRLRPPGVDHSPGPKDVLTTSFLYHMIDTGWGRWAYLGPSTAATDEKRGAPA